MGQSEIASLTPQSFISFGDVAHVEYSETPGNHRGNLTFNMVSLLIGRLRRAYLYCTQYSIPSISRKIPTAADFWPDSPPTIVGASLARSPCPFFFFFTWGRVSLPGKVHMYHTAKSPGPPNWNKLSVEHVSHANPAGRNLKVVGKEMPE